MGSSGPFEKVDDQCSGWRCVICSPEAILVSGKSFRSEGWFCCPCFHSLLVERKPLQKGPGSEEREGGRIALCGLIDMLQGKKQWSGECVGFELVWTITLIYPSAN